MSKKWQYGTIGSISSATMRPEDLIPAFCSELRYLGHRSKELTKIEKRYNTAINGEFGENDAYFQDEVSSWDLDSLFDMLDTHALPYMYFGAHAGNGSDYGFWVIDGLEYDFDGLKVSDTGDVPSDYTGDVMHINERGNMTLYACKRGKLTEIWAVV